MFISNTSKTPHSFKWTNDCACPQCNRPLTVQELPNNACNKCIESIGRVLQAKPGAPITFINTTPINETAIEGESHD